MNELRKIRLELRLEQTEVVADLIKEAPSIDVSMLSRFENERCLPTPRGLRAICKRYNKTPLEIYPREEIDLLAIEREMRKATAADGEEGFADVSGFEKPPRTRERRRGPKMTIRVTQSLASRVARQIKTLGVNGQTEYLSFCAHLIDRIDMTPDLRYLLRR